MELYLEAEKERLSTDQASRDGYYRVIQTLSGLKEIRVCDNDTWFDKDKEDMTLETVTDAFGSSLERNGVPSSAVEIKVKSWNYGDWRWQADLRVKYTVHLLIHICLGSPPRQKKLRGLLASILTLLLIRYRSTYQYYESGKFSYGRG
jgi:hypothetical protein